jgi:hypothetical protein
LTDTVIQKASSEITDAAKCFADIRRLLERAELEISMGLPVGGLMYLIRIVCEDISKINVRS